MVPFHTKIFHQLKRHPNYRESNQKLRYLIHENLENQMTINENFLRHFLFFNIETNDDDLFLS
jgi:hypothetical protein